MQWRIAKRPDVVVPEDDPEAAPPFEPVEVFEGDDDAVRARLAALYDEDGGFLFVAEGVSSSALLAISDRQFAQALADLGVISRAEALAFVKRGEVPTALQAAIDSIPDDEARFAAEMQVSGATTFERTHPSTVALAQALGWSDEQMDNLWRQAAAL